MTVTWADYLEDFSCTAGACEETCCGVWGLRENAPHLSPCQYLNAGGLCRVQIKGRYDTLCDICKLYPAAVRRTEKGDFALGLHLACPAAVQAALFRGRPVAFRRAGAGEALPKEAARLVQTALEASAGWDDGLASDDFMEEVHSICLSMVQDGEPGLEGALWRIDAFLGESCPAAPGPAPALAPLLVARVRGDGQNHLLHSFARRLDDAPDDVAAYLDAHFPMGPFLAYLQRNETALRNYFAALVFAVRFPWGDEGYGLPAAHKAKELLLQYQLFGRLFAAFHRPGCNEDALVALIARSVYKNYRFKTE